LPPSAGGGIEKVPGVFISRLVPGGLAESTGLLAVNDEVLEVNGIEVAGKTLDQASNINILKLYIILWNINIRIIILQFIKQLLQYIYKIKFICNKILGN